MIALFTSWFFVALRLGLIARLIAAHNIVACIFAASELLALSTTVYSLKRGRVDYSVSGALAPLLYVTPLLFDLSAHYGPPAALAAYLMLCPVQWLIRLRLGVRCTVGAPVYTSLCSSWPYSVVRHPLAATEIALCTSLAFWLSTPWNFFAWALTVAAGILAVLIEERFLKSTEYTTYCKHVPFRFIPGVW